MSRNIGIFTLAYPPFVGGAEIAVKEITSRLPDFRFQIFTHDFDKYGSVRIAKFFYIFRAWRAAEKAHRQSPLSAIWAIMAAYGGTAALLFKLRHPSVPFLLTLQEGDSEEHILKRVGIFYPIWRMIFRKTDRIQVISNYLADFARRHGAKCQIDVIPNGVNVGAFSVERLAYSEKPKTLNPKRYTLITTSRLVHKNGIDTLIRAVAQLPITNYKLQILGTGPDEAKLKQLAKDLKVEDKIEFLGHADPEKIPEYLAKADIFARPSRSEGLGNSFLEAMAAGLPVIGTPAGGIPDFLKSHNTNTQMNTNDTNNESNGLFVNVDDPKDLADKISLLLQDEKLRKRLGENGRKLVLENYSWDSISKKMKVVFQSLYPKPYTLNPRILVATGIYPPDIGGPATYTVLLEKELPKRGFKVAVLPFGVVRRLPRVIRHFVYFLKCVWMLKNNDFIYAQDPVSVGLPAMLAAKIRGKKFFVRVAGDYAWEQAAQRFGIKDGIDDFQKKKYDWRTELLRKIQKWVVGNADLVITPSKYFQKLVGGWVSNSDKVKTIYNGIESEHQASSVMRQEKGKTIVSAGRLVPWKGFDVLIELMKNLPDWRLIIAGDGPEREALSVKRQASGVTNRVQLIGSVPREELLDYLRMASIFVLNTSFESFSFQVVEAMNAGTPVIATKIGNLEEIITDGKEGILVEPNNKEQILAAIKKIDSNDNFRKTIVQNARKKSEQFSIDKTVDNLVELIHNTNTRMDTNDTNKKQGAQVKKEHYFRKKYDDLDRFISYYYQVNLVQEVLEVNTNTRIGTNDTNTILEIGKGNGLFSDYLKKIGYSVTTCDFDENLKPDVVADVRNLPFPENSFDAVAAFEVLEHIPFEDFAKALAGIAKISKKYAIISLPYRSTGWEFVFKFPGIRTLFKKPFLSFFLRLPLKFGGIKVSGQHYWEIDRWNYRISKVRAEIRKQFKILKEVRPVLNHYHYFFVLEKK